MPELTGKDRRLLRSRGQRLRPAAAVGKAGASEAVALQISMLLDIHELVKVRLQATGGAERKALAESLAKAVGAECVGLTGRNALLYRPNEQADKNNHIAAG